MRIKRLFLLLTASTASGQTVASQSLSDVLTAQSATLSTLNTWLTSEQLVYSMLSNAQGVTLLAPSNNALTQLYSTSLANQLGQDANLLTAFLSYHVLNGTYTIADLTSVLPSSSVPTFLDISAYSNVTGGQRVDVIPQNGGLTFVSGNGAQSNVQTYDFNYIGGILHIIDAVLTIPATLTNTLITAGLTAAVGALRRASVETALNSAADLTIFAPTNAAFNAIGSLVEGMTAQQLSTVLNYHVVQGRVLYSQMLEAGSQVVTAQGGNVSVRVVGGGVFVNSARVVQADLLVGNGVVHVVDGVLNPDNSTATPDPSAATQAPAFNGATSTADGVPFTSGVTLSTATPTINVSPVPVAMAPPMRTAAVGMAALFGGAAVLAGL